MSWCNRFKKGPFSHLTPPPSTASSVVSLNQWFVRIFQNKLFTTPVIYFIFKFTILPDRIMSSWVARLPSLKWTDMKVLKLWLLNWINPNFTPCPQKESQQKTLLKWSIMRHKRIDSPRMSMEHSKPTWKTIRWRLSHLLWGYDASFVKFQSCKCRWKYMKLLFGIIRCSIYTTDVTVKKTGVCVSNKKWSDKDLSIFDL